MNSDAIHLLLKKHPNLSRYQDRLEAMQPGAYCIHRSWGIGRIADYDEANLRLIIDFEEGKEGHAMDPAFCVDKLEILPENHPIVRQRSNPEEVEELIKKRQADLVCEIISYYGDEASTGEIERMLQKLIGDTKYKKWWTATKKLLVKDPRIATPSKKTAPYILRDEPVKAEEEVLEEFYITKSAPKQIALAERLVELSVSHEDIQDALPDILKTLTDSLKKTHQLNQGERLNGIWVRNDLARFIHEDVETLEPTSKSIIDSEHDQLHKLVDQLPSTRYGRLLDLLYRVQPDTWERTTFDLLKYSEGKFTSECISFMVQKKKLERIGEVFGRWLGEQNLKAPILVWIIKNRGTRRFTKILQPLIGPRLLAAIFNAIDNEALQSSSNRRIPLADLLSEDQEIIPELLAEASPEVARDLANMLLLNQGFEELTKKSLLARFIRLFPNTQALVDSGASTGPKDDLIVSKVSLERLLAEYDDLIKKKIPANKEAIAIAREHGDLKENSEYKMARQDQDVLLARKTQIERDTARAQSTEFKDAPTDLVGVGSVVELERQNGEIVKYSILGAWDSKPEDNILSYKTPLGQSLLSKKVGETVSTVIDGVENTWKIREITRWIDLGQEL